MPLEFARGARVVPGGLGDRGPLVGAARVGLRGAVSRLSGGVGGPGAALGPGCRSWWRVPSGRAPGCGGPPPAPCAGWPDGGGGTAAPFVPLPGEAYWRFRLVTAYGGDGDTGELTPADVVAFLRWCQRSRPRRG